jgi:hypothetical protein
MSTDAIRAPFCCITGNSGIQLREMISLLTLNPYDPYVDNKVVEHKQQTVCWHVDDCKLSHV